MTAEPGNERRSRALLRFGLSGIVCTILGPSLFWLAYPLGPFVAMAVAVAAAERLLHSLRFVTFRALLFPPNKWYRVSLPRYVVSALPVSLTGVIVVALLRNRQDCTTLALTGSLIALMVGFLWIRYVYSRPIAKRVQADHTSSS
jgi:putative flippase GtrA